MDSSTVITEKDWLACCGSAKFAQEMVSAGPFSDYQQAVDAARDIWFNKVDVNGWLEAFDAHPAIGQSPSKTTKSPTSAQWSKGEQSTALATATDATLQELYDWNARYRQKFGFVFLICASGRSTPEILAEIKRRFHNRPIIEFDNAANEQMKITELRMSKLFPANATSGSAAKSPTTDVVTKAGDRMNVIGGHLMTPKEVHSAELPTRTRPPITTHILDTARGAPASGIEVRLETWSSNQTWPSFGQVDSGCWKLEGSSITDKDGRSGQLTGIVDALKPGIYRISFDTGKYNPDGFFPYAIREKIQDLKEMRRAKAEAKEEEKAERELAKSRLEVAKEVRMAREAEAAMDFHVQKAAEKAAEHEKRFASGRHSGGIQNSLDDYFQVQDAHSRGFSAPAGAGGYSANSGNIYGGGAAADSGHDTAFLDAPGAPLESPARNNLV